MERHDIMVRALASTAAVVRDLTPQQAGLPTPCGDWDVRSLSRHLFLVAEALRLAGRGEPVPGEHWTATPAGSFDEAAADAWKAPEAWERPVRMGDMPMPAGTAAAMLVSDVVIHGWDLARATGRPFRVDDDVAAATLEFVTAMGEQGRTMGAFGPAVHVPDGAPVLDRALALSGRDPSR